MFREKNKKKTTWANLQNVIILILKILLLYRFFVEINKNNNFVHPFLNVENIITRSCNEIKKNLI